MIADLPSSWSRRHRPCPFTKECGACIPHRERGRTKWEGGVEEWRSGRRRDSSCYCGRETKARHHPHMPYLDVREDLGFEGGVATPPSNIMFRMFRSSWNGRLDGSGTWNRAAFRQRTLHVRNLGLKFQVGVLGSHPVTDSQGQMPWRVVSLFGPALPHSYISLNRNSDKLLWWWMDIIPSES